MPELRIGGWSGARSAPDIHLARGAVHTCVGDAAPLGSSAFVGMTQHPAIIGLRRALEAADPVREALRAHWQVPAMAAAVGLLGLGILTAFQTAVSPDFDRLLNVAEDGIEEGRYETSMELLNARVLPYVGRSAMTREHRRRFHTLMARALYGGQRELEFPHPENDRNVVGQYAEAERFDANLGAEDLRRLSESLLALDRFDLARDRIEQIPDKSREIRDGLTKQLVRGLLRATPPRPEDALDVLASVLSDPGVPPDTRVWALAEQADVRGDLGFHDEAVTHLLRVMPTLIGKPGVEAAPLHLALGQAYLELGALEEAEKQLVRVDRDDAAAPGTPMRAEAIMLRGRVDMQRAREPADVELARDRFQTVVDHYAATDAYPSALLSLAEAEAQLDRIDASLSAYEDLMALLEAPDPPHEPTREQVSASLMDQHEREAARRAWRDALRFADTAAALWSFENTPAPILLALAQAHEAVAQEILSAAASSEDGSASSGLARLEQRGADPGAQQQAKRHLVQAASFYNAHADRFVVDDLETHADSLWKAARLYDRAGAEEQAIRVYAAFETVARGDPRRPEARFRLAQAQHARGDFTAAADGYRSLIRDQRSEGPGAVGPWADRSLVPLAQALMSDGDETNDGEAESVLLDALSSTRGGPDRVEYAQALRELGKLRTRQDRYDRALERFIEARERIGDANADASLLFRIADARHRLAEQIAEEIEQEMPEGQRRALVAARQEHLEEAATLFERVRETLAAKTERARTPLEDEFLRNATFYVGDVAAELGHHEAAIAHYREARRRYPEDPASLVALIQVVTEYVELGDLASARVANQQARDFFQRLPEDVWDDPALPMGREDWQLWLESNTRLYEQMARGNTEQAG